MQIPREQCCVIALGSKEKSKVEYSNKAHE